MTLDRCSSEVRHKTIAMEAIRVATSALIVDDSKLSRIGKAVAAIWSGLGACRGERYLRHPERFGAGQGRDHRRSQNAINLVREFLYRLNTTNPIPATTGAPFGEPMYRAIVEGEIEGPRLRASLADPSAEVAETV
jgi:hypothetical protein